MITQPDNTTACIGETVMFTCVIDTSDINVNVEDVSWWRKRRNHNNDLLPDPSMISQQGSTRIRIIKHNNGKNLTSVLMINDVRTSDAGPYWLSLMDTEHNTITSTMAFLSIVPNGMHNCIYA